MKMNYFQPGEYVTVEDGKGDINNVLLPLYLKYDHFKVLYYEEVGGRDCYFCESGDKRKFCFHQSVLRKA